MTGAYMHKMRCCACNHEFYTKLPDPLEGPQEREIECVNCESVFNREYEFSIVGGKIEVGGEITLLEDKT